ncbi:MAG: hypothetical protein V1766_01875 [Pseudomonadota bacterium]
MQYIFTGICFLGAVAIMLIVRSLDLNAGLTVAIILPTVLLVIYSLARLQPKKPAAEKVSDMERVAETSEKVAHA